MHDQQLSELLRRAENAGSAASRQGPEMDADGVRKKIRRVIVRRNVGRVIGAMILCTGAGLLASHELSKPPGSKEIKQPPVVAIPPQDAGGRDQDPSSDALDVRQRIADAAQARLDHRRALAWAAGLDPVDPVAARDEAARTMVLVAHKRAEIIDKQEAVQLYQRAITLFPETQWAAIAGREIKQLNKPN